MNALIISLNFHPGHVSHLVASYKQCEELGYKSIYYVDSYFEKYLPTSTRIIKYNYDAKPKADIAIFLFPSHKNIKQIWQMKREGTKVIYIFHEPLSSMGEYRKAGFSYKYLVKLWVINHISALTVKLSDIILLPSNKALEFYENNSLYKNANYHYIPLMYDDERQKCHTFIPRKYFSYIGTVAADHSFSEYLDFICWAVRKNILPELMFMIVTKSVFEIPDELKNNFRVVIKQGYPMTDEEINTYYASTFVVWNAYVRTTQSGVLAKSFMFGTPALVLKKNCNEFVHDGIEVKVVEDNTNKEEIAAAIEDIMKDFDVYSENCRKQFLNLFYYRKYNNRFESLIK